MWARYNVTHDTMSGGCPLRRCAPPPPAFGWRRKAIVRDRRTAT